VQVQAGRTTFVVGGAITATATGPCVLTAPVTATDPVGGPSHGPLGGLGLVTCTVTSTGGATGWGACAIYP
jgi:hypothetical protein